MYIYDICSASFYVPGLNHNKWHRVSLSLDVETHHLYAEVDQRGRTSLLVEAFVDNNLTEAYGPGKRTSIVSIGGNNDRMSATTILLGPLKTKGCGCFNYKKKLCLYDEKIIKSTARQKSE